jgi:hypothetical protein
MALGGSSVSFPSYAPHLSCLHPLSGIEYTDAVTFASSLVISGLLLKVLSVLMVSWGEHERLSLFS